MVLQFQAILNITLQLLFDIALGNEEKAKNIMMNLSKRKETYSKNYLIYNFKYQLTKEYNDSQ